MTARVFFYVQHLLGIGHLRRAATLARALAAGGFDVLLVSGGAPVDGLGARRRALPSTAAGARRRCAAEGAGAARRHAARRCLSRASARAQLLDLFEAEAPDILLTEQFPFGRTQLRFELLPLLEAAQDRPSPPWIVSSIRDVLRRTASPARVDEMVADLRGLRRRAGPCRSRPGAARRQLSRLARHPGPRALYRLRRGVRRGACADRRRSARAR